MAPNSVNASKRKHKNQINHYNKQRLVLMANSTGFNPGPAKPRYALAAFTNSVDPDQLASQKPTDLDLHYLSFSM